MLLSCVVLSYVYDFIFGQGLLCCVFDFMPNQNGFFLSYLMLVPILRIQYKLLAVASFLTAVLYVGAFVCES
jgi:hypothetical protein